MPVVVSCRVVAVKAGVGPGEALPVQPVPLEKPAIPTAAPAGATAPVSAAMAAPSAQRKRSVLVDNCIFLTSLTTAVAPAAAGNGINRAHGTAAARNASLSDSRKAQTRTKKAQR